MNIGWDIGIKNLSYCIIDKNNKIFKWGILDLCNTESYKCCGITKKGDICNKTAKRIDKSTLKLYCNIHSKKCDYHDISKCFECEKKAKFKTNDNKFYCTKHSKKKLDIYEIKFNMRDINKIGNNLIKSLNTNREMFLNVNTIVIENQPVLKYPTMKSVQMILYTYYLINKQNDKYKIKLVHANSKLKFKITNKSIEKIKKLKNKYQMNKKLSVEYCKTIITQSNLDFLNKEKKKEDLSDAFLLIYYEMINI